MRKNILLVGQGPLIIEKDTITIAGGIRTWHFLKAIFEQTNYNITLVNIVYPDKYSTHHPVNQTGTYLLKKEDLYFSDFNNRVQITLVNKDKINLKSFLLNQIADNNFSAVVAINNPPSSLVASLNLDIPLFCDLNGWLMSEGQSQSSRIKNNAYLGHYWQMEKNIIQKADKMSTVSHHQKHATIGELASIGRLNQWTDEYEFVEVIKNATDTDTVKLLKEVAPPDYGIKDKIPNYDPRNFYLLRIGTFNTREDVNTLFTGIEKAIQANPKVCFLYTGKEIKGLDNSNYQKFLHLVNSSPYKNNFVGLGWVTREEISALYKISNVGINIERPNYENKFGGRNRLNEFLINKLPFITSLGSEIALETAYAGLSFGVEFRDSKNLTKKIIELAELKKNNPSYLTILGKKGYSYAVQNYSFVETTKPLLKWLENPSKAPDYNKNFVLKNSLLKRVIIYTQKNGIKAILKKIF